MVKKIRVIDDTPDDTPAGGERDWVELAKSMDWKLWEILQIMQKLEKSLKGMEISIPEEEDEKTE